MSDSGKGKGKGKKNVAPKARAKVGLSGVGGATEPSLGRRAAEKQAWFLHLLGAGPRGLQ
eukprot:4287202-Prymnesium_polylepis.1